MSRLVEKDLRNVTVDILLWRLTGSFLKRTERSARSKCPFFQIKEDSASYFGLVDCGRACTTVSDLEIYGENGGGGNPAKKDAIKDAIKVVVFNEEEQMLEIMLRYTFGRVAVPCDTLMPGDSHHRRLRSLLLCPVLHV